MKINRRWFLVAAAVQVMVGIGIGRIGVPAATPAVTTMRVPDNGIQPQVATDSRGTVHLIYYKGEPGAGDIFYVRSTDGGATWSRPLRVNSQRGSAIATGNIRGAQLAIGKDNRVHVAWNGSGQALPKGVPNPFLPADSPYRAGSPMLYTRLNDAGTGFEPQRNLMQFTYGLDGGGTVAADNAGHVYVAWHSAAGMVKGEAARRLYVARSDDDGQTFTREAPAWDRLTGACGCCGVKAFTDSKGTVYIIYRAATENVDRDMYVLTSKDHGATFAGQMVDRWKVDTCPMSSESFTESATGVRTAWETRGQVRSALIEPVALQAAPPASAPGDGNGRKYPVLASNANGEYIFAWTEGMGWDRGGAVAWQVYDAQGQPIPGAAGRRDGVPKWSMVAAFARPDGGFTVVY